MNYRASVLVACLVCLSTTALAGKVIIGGDDLPLHGSYSAGANQKGWLYIEKALTSMFQSGCITRPNDGTIAALGVVDATTTCCDAGAAIHYAAQELSPPRTVTYVEGAAAINAYLAGVASGSNTPAVIWIAQNYDIANDLDNLETDALTANASTLASFVNSGGALMAHTEAGYPGGNPWLADIIPGLTETAGCQSFGATLTPAGTAAFPGLTNADINDTAGPCHSTFAGIGNLQVLATDGQGGNYIIGGDCSTVIGEPPFDCPPQLRMEKHIRANLCSAPGDTTNIYTAKFNVGANCTAAGWTSADLSGRGHYALIGSGALQQDECAQSLSCLWSFINNSTEFYNCNTPPAPTQRVVPHMDVQGRYLHNEIWSPTIMIPQCQNLVLRFSAYRDLSYHGLVFYTWRVRSLNAAGQWSPWRDRGLVYYGERRDWYTHVEQLSPFINPNALAVQIALGAWDMCGSWCGYIADGACHSHAPLIDNVSLLRVTATGPQWSIRDMDQFQDNFPEDGTITGCVRADMAADILPIENPGILPGDSAVVTVGDCVNGLALDPDFGGPAVYLYVRVQGPTPKGGPGLVDTPARFPFAGTQVVNGTPWNRVRMDSTCAVGTYCVDLNDCYFTPCDTVWFFYSATNNAGATTYAYGSKLDCQGSNISVAAANASEFTCLPTLCCHGSGDILWVDGMDGRGQQQFWDSSFGLLGLVGTVDRFDVRAPSSAVGNRLGSRVKDVEQQLACYQKIIWDCGDLEVTVGDGSGSPEKSPDYCLLNSFLANLTSPGGVYIGGDNVANELNLYASACAVTFRATFMPYIMGPNNHHLVPTSYLVSPKAIAWPGRAFTDNFIMFGGCPEINGFDVTNATGTSLVQMSYNIAQNANAAVLSNVNGFARVMMAGFGFAYIRDDDLNNIQDRSEYLYDVITWLGNTIQFPTGAGPVLRNELLQNHPNPFNPSTTLAFSTKDHGHVSLKVYNVNGALVRTLVDEERSAGQYTVNWDGRGHTGREVASGVYFYKMVAKDYSQTKKMVLLK